MVKEDMQEVGAKEGEVFYQSIYGQSAVAAPNENAGRRRVIFQQYILHYQ